MPVVEKWGTMDLAFCGRSDGNPFMDYNIIGTFSGGNPKETKRAEGFYDGNGVYRIRFMPSSQGIYHYEIEGSFMSEKTDRNMLQGDFEVSSAGADNHGPVRVYEETHLIYEDGTPYYSMGTTCYAWTHQKMELQEQTLDTLEHSPFNKIRFCIFPKFYDYNRKEPLTYPFVRGNGEGQDPELIELEKQNLFLFPGQIAPEWDRDFDYTRPNTEHFQRLDLRIRQLRDLGIEADIILMHPYDRWGMNTIGKDAIDSYLRYCVARFSAYRNVWWSLANEYDLIKTRTVEDWDHYGELIQSTDPYDHLRSVHNCMPFYDYTKPWVTHCSMQRQDFYKTTEDTDLHMKTYCKPVVWDEIAYEGNIQLGWGNITAQELVRRFWEAFMRGGHAGHGETFLDPEEILWWSHGGPLKGESAPRIQFLLDILKDTPGKYVKKTGSMFDCVNCVPSYIEKEDIPFNIMSADYEIDYFGIMQPAFREIMLAEDKQFRVEIIDTWNMTIEDAGIHSGFTRISMPGNQYMALRIIRVNNSREVLS